MVLYKRDDRMMTKVKWPIETNDIDDEFMREYDDVKTDNFHHLLMKFHSYVRTHFYTPNDKN